MRFSVRSLPRIALMTAITCVCAVLALPTPFSPTPITFSLFAIILCGGLLPPGAAFVCQTIYLLLGCVGLPVFSGFSSGIGVLFGPTGGYLLTYPFMALLVSLSTRLRWKGAAFWGSTAALLLCYLTGSLWMCILTGCSFAAAVTVAVLPFLLPDLAKIALALWIHHRLQKHPHFFRSV